MFFTLNSYPSSPSRFGYSHFSGSPTVPVFLGFLVLPVSWWEASHALKLTFYHRLRSVRAGWLKGDTPLRNPQ
ncbi:hypothetical protein Cal6303_5732 (plasmid) [Calothrix sp. PCC 6303]|nr:hypothetical protein Cal6303_5732 [Calothrix sp. PCC 6303]